MAGRGRVFTIFDVMEDKGVFRANSANPNAVDREGRPLYAGPVTAGIGPVCPRAPVLSPGLSPCLYGGRPGPPSTPRVGGTDSARRIEG